MSVSDILTIINRKQNDNLDEYFCQQFFFFFLDLSLWFFMINYHGCCTNNTTLNEKEMRSKY